MYGSKHKTNVVLFPLCDTSGVLRDALRDTSHSPETRGDAIVFAWRLELPKSMNLAHAANAQLVVAMNVPRESWTRQQLLIIRELMVLAGREGKMPQHVPAVTESVKGSVKEPVKESVKSSARKPKPSRKTVSRSTMSSRLEAVAERGKKAVDPKSVVEGSKESKAWWQLVGKQGPADDMDPAERQRKIRKERVSREPGNKG